MSNQQIVHPFLTIEENEILNEWMNTSTKPKLSTATSLRLYELFLQGTSVYDIAEVNGGVFSIGQILFARITDRWDERKRQHLDRLYGGIIERFTQIQSEGMSFIADVMAMQHKLYGDKIKKFLQSHDEADLHGIPSSYMSGEGYRKMIDALMKITGQDKQKAPIEDRVPHTKESERREITVIPMKALPVGATPAIDTSAASQILRKLDDMGVGKA